MMRQFIPRAANQLFKLFDICSKSLLHDQRSSGQLRATHARHINHATKKANKSLEVERICDNVSGLKSPLQMYKQFHAPTQSRAEQEKSRKREKRARTDQ